MHSSDLGELIITASMKNICKITFIFSVCTQQGWEIIVLQQNNLPEDAKAADKIILVWQFQAFKTKRQWSSQSFAHVPAVK